MTWRISPRTKTPPSYELPSVDLPRAALRPIRRDLCRLKAHAFVEVARGSSRQIVCAKSDDRQLGRRLNQPKAVLHKHLSDSLSLPALSHREPADRVVRRVGCREEQRAHQRPAGSAILLADTEGGLPRDVPLKRRLEAGVSHHRAKQRLNLRCKIEPGGNICGL